ncbi:MAG: hypothetical protein KUG82_19660 [Pseudomonadales bacterium]|nr:hypothetical protein [Pseudomonadales bacterium]
MKLDLASEYKIHEIIFANSGSNYYVRLPVDAHAAVISDNNSGKTSSLSALKLFLLPEITFKKQKDKFGFQSGGKHYEDLSSYTYYFPGYESFIVCNASNPKGKFCWVLYRTSDLGYERIAVPHEYDDFKHLLWNQDSKKNENAGELQPDIHVKKIVKQLTSDYGGKIFTDKKSIGVAIYSRTSNADDDSRYCLLPMAKGYSTNIADTIRSLLSMAFSLSNASTTSLPMAMASILDGAGMSAVRKRDSEGIFLDLDSQLEEWRELKGIAVRLKLIESKKDDWGHLQEVRADYERMKRGCKDRFVEIAWSLQAKKMELNEVLNELRGKARDVEETLVENLPIHNEVKSRYSEAVIAELAAKRSLSTISERIERVRSVRSFLSALCPDDDKSDQAVLVVLDGQIEECESEIKGLEGQSQARVQMVTLDEQIRKNKLIRKQLIDVIESLASENSFLDGLSSHSASILLSLNSQFSKLSFTPSLEQKSVIEDFTKLFSMEGSNLSFCDLPMLEVDYIVRDNQAIKRRHVKEIDGLTDSIESDDKLLLKLKKNSELTKEQQVAKLADCKEELKELIGQRSALLAADDLESQNIEAEHNVAIAGENLQQIETVWDAERLKRECLYSDLNSVNTTIDEKTFPLKQIESDFSELARIEAASQRMLDLDRTLLEFDAERAQDISPENTKTALDELSRQSIGAQHKKTDSISAMGSLLQHGVVESTPEERYQITMNRERFDAHYSDLQAVFLNLDVKKDTYKERLAHHNNTAATASRMIENVESIVTNFIKGINDELKEYRISNLNAVEMVAELHPQYCDMLKTLNRVGSRTDELLSEEFYKQISDFQDQFYIKNPGKIDIAKIIEKISYRFERNDLIEDTPQSNGTNCMVNATMLALLLKKMVPEDLNLTMPVVFDEVGSLDENNFQEILKVMEGHGLYLFVANPENNGTIASVLDVYHDLSVFKATDVMVEGKAEAIYFPRMEERLEYYAVSESEA